MNFSEELRSAEAHYHNYSVVVKSGDNMGRQTLRTNRVLGYNIRFRLSW